MERELMGVRKKLKTPGSVKERLAMGGIGEAGCLCPGLLEKLFGSCQTQRWRRSSGLLHILNIELSLMLQIRIVGDLCRCVADWGFAIGLPLVVFLIVIA